MLQAQAPAPVHGVPYLRLVWNRIVDMNGELGSVESAEFSPDGSRIAAVTKYSNDISVWRTADGTRLWNFRADEEQEIAVFSRDGRWLASGGEDDVLRVFEAETGKLTKTIPHPAGIDALHWSPDGRFLATGDENGVVRLFRLTDWSLAGQAQVGKEAVNELDFSPDSKLLLVTADSNAARVLDTATMKEVKAFSRDGKSPRTTGRFSHDGKMIAVGGMGGEILVWDYTSGELIRAINFTGQKVETLIFHPEGGYLLYAGHDPHIRVVRIQDGSAVHLSQPVDHAEYVTVSRNGSWVASAHQDGIIRLWVWMRGDPGLNKRLHSALEKKQEESAAARKKN
jgi:WD40 repeat protein